MPLQTIKQQRQNKASSITHFERDLGQFTGEEYIEKMIGVDNSHSRSASQLDIRSGIGIFSTVNECCFCFRVRFQRELLL
jgi:hypothetical protein